MSSPTQRTNEYLKRNGWTSGIVEKHLPFPKPKGDKTVPETWKDIPGYDEYYQVSDQGRVRSKDRFTRGFGSSRFCRGQILTPALLKDDVPYRYVTLCVKAQRIKFLIHRLVLLAFVGQCPDGMECRHFPDPDPANNRLENLQWGLPTDNGQDRIAHGTSNRGETQGQSKLTRQQVKQLRKLRQNGLSWQVLGLRFSISASQARRVALGIEWAWLP